jgi:hypothetical protein
VTFFLKANVFIALVTYKISHKNSLHIISKINMKVRHVPGVAAIVFNSITSISEIVIASLGAKGL